MKPLFVSYMGQMGSDWAKGWCVLINHPPLITPEDMKELVVKLEDERSYNPGSLILISFQRLESES